MEEQTNVNFLTDFNLDEYLIPEMILGYVPREVALRHKLVPLSFDGNSFIVAMVDSSNQLAIDDIKFLTGYTVQVATIPVDQIERALVKYYGSAVTLTGADDDYGALLESFVSEPVEEEETPDVGQLEGPQDFPIVRLVNLILVDAVKRGASSIHLETYSADFRIRYRIDNRLYEVMRPPLKMKEAIVVRFKIMANLDIVNRRLPQKGRIENFMGKSRNVDFDISTMPTAHGEKVTLSILDKTNARLRLEDLGFEDSQFEQLQQVIDRKSGLVLFTGPVGSGRRTTLYTLLNNLNDPCRNIFTVEESLMTDISGINQVCLNPKIGLDLGTAVRYLNTQDVDVMMVGEAPWDKETVEILIRSSLSGRLVLSSFQTKDTVFAIDSILDMGVSPFLLTSSLSLVCAQRLARRICSKCKAVDNLPAGTAEAAGFIPEDATTIQFKSGTGCRDCGYTCYKGFVGIQEVLVLSDEIKKAILRGDSSAQLKQKAMELGMVTLRQAGLQKVREGLTTIGEILRVTPAD